MRILRGSVFNKVGVVAVVAGLAAGCSSAVERFGDQHTYTGSTDNQRDIINGGRGQPSYQDIVNGPGGTVGGLPPRSSQPVYTNSVPAQSGPIVSRPLPAAAPPAPVVAARSAPVQSLPAPEASPRSTRQIVRSGNDWKGWTGTGGTGYTVRAGDNLKAIGRRYGVPIQALVAVNGIEDPTAYPAAVP